MGRQKEKLIEEMDYMMQARPALYLTPLQYQELLNQSQNVKKVNRTTTNR